MKKIMLVGRSGAGKTTLTQALKGKTITYHNTQ
ncbi:MAG: EutP/PduV family microcompartment system protein [Lachnospiraceae bacterium]